MDKELMGKALQASINTYHGSYGEVDESIYTDRMLHTMGHVEWETGWIDDNTMVIAFRGTDGFKDWRDNFKFRQKVIPFIAYRRVKRSVRAHRGFLLQYFKVRYQIHQLMERFQFTGTRLVITGHSLGGALAIICALDLKLKGITKEIICIPFASPRVGNWSFRRLFNEELPGTRLIQYGRDMVCKVPPWIFGFVHIGKKLKLKRRLTLKSLLLFPKFLLIGNPWDHYPQRYLEAIDDL